jgi:hypothetical protein
MTNYVAALVHLVPNALVRYKGNNNPYNEIAWLDERTQPTEAECDAIWPQVEYEAAYANTESARQSRYVAETDGIFFDAMRTGAALSPWVDAVELIKTALPYPEQPAA